MQQPTRPDLGLTGQLQRNEGTQEILDSPGSQWWSIGVCRDHLAIVSQYSMYCTQQLKTFTRLKTLDDFLKMCYIWLLGDLGLGRKTQQQSRCMEDAHKFHLKVWLTKTKAAAAKSMFSTLVVQVWLSSERLIKSPIVTGNLFSDGNMPTTPVKLRSRSRST